MSQYTAEFGQDDLRGARPKVGSDTLARMLFDVYDATAGCPDRLDDKDDFFIEDYVANKARFAINICNRHNISVAKSISHDSRMCKMARKHTRQNPTLRQYFYPSPINSTNG